MLLVDEREHLTTAEIADDDDEAGVAHELGQAGTVHVVELDGPVDRHAPRHPVPIQVRRKHGGLAGRAGELGVQVTHPAPTGGIPDSAGFCEVEELPERPTPTACAHRQRAAQRRDPAAGTGEQCAQVSEEQLGARRQDRVGACRLQAVGLRE